MWVASSYQLKSRHQIKANLPQKAGYWRGVSVGRWPSDVNRFLLPEFLGFVLGWSLWRPTLCHHERYMWIPSIRVSRLPHETYQTSTSCLNGRIMKEEGAAWLADLKSSTTGVSNSFQSARHLSLKCDARVILGVESGLFSQEEDMLSQLKFTSFSAECGVHREKWPGLLSWILSATWSTVHLPFTTTSVQRTPITSHLEMRKQRCKDIRPHILNSYWIIAQAFTEPWSAFDTMVGI